MGDENKSTIYIFGLIGIILLCVGGMYYLQNQLQKNEAKVLMLTIKANICNSSVIPISSPADCPADYCPMCERCEMYGYEAKNVTNYINGFYTPNKYYCVWIDNRSKWDIDETDRHEYCHHLVTLTPEHFCGYAYNCTNPKEWSDYNISRIELMNYTLANLTKVNLSNVSVSDNLSNVNP